MKFIVLMVTLVFGLLLCTSYAQEGKSVLDNAPIPISVEKSSEKVVEKTESPVVPYSKPVFRTPVRDTLYDITCKLDKLSKHVKCKLNEVRANRKDLREARKALRGAYLLKYEWVAVPTHKWVLKRK